MSSWSIYKRAGPPRSLQTPFNVSKCLASFSRSAPTARSSARMTNTNVRWNDGCTTRPVPRSHTAFAPAAPQTSSRKTANRRSTQAALTASSKSHEPPSLFGLGPHLLPGPRADLSQSLRAKAPLTTTQERLPTSSYRQKFPQESNRATPEGTRAKHYALRDVSRKALASENAGVNTPHRAGKRARQLASNTREAKARQALNAVIGWQQALAPKAANDRLRYRRGSS